jgi:hypothetical protein
MEEILIIVVLVAIILMFLILIGNTQTRKIIADLLFGRM